MTEPIELTEGILPGVTAPTIKKIRDANITTVDSLATINPRDLADKAKMSSETAEKAVEKAIDLIYNGYITGNQLWDKRKTRTRLTTGSDAVDEVLAGGIESETTTEIAAANGVGKTQLCHMLAVTAQLPVEQGGLDGDVAWIDTEGTFIPSRIDQICRARGYDTEAVLSRIHHGLALNAPHQKHLIGKLYQLCPERNVKLIIVDSLMGLLRSEYLGRGNLGARQDELKDMLLTLSKVARSTRTTVVYTNQVMDNPGVLYGNPERATGGNVMGHAATTRIHLRKGREGARVLRVTKSPYLPECEAVFFITEAGIVDAAGGKRKTREVEDDDDSRQKENEE